MFATYYIFRMLAYKMFITYNYEICNKEGKTYDFKETFKPLMKSGQTHNF